MCMDVGRIVGRSSMLLLTYMLPDLHGWLVKGSRVELPLKSVACVCVHMCMCMCMGKSQDHTPYYWSVLLQLTSSYLGNHSKDSDYEYYSSTTTSVLNTGRVYIGSTVSINDSHP